MLVSFLFQTLTSTFFLNVYGAEGARVLYEGVGGVQGKCCPLSLPPPAAVLLCC